jgi:phosphoribosylformimino-5-aminoimidazole carboxamide ribotide isomerase
LLGSKHGSQGSGGNFATCSLVQFAVRIVGVIDLLAGRAVHARGGMRDTYQPVESVAGAAIVSGDATALARAYVDRLRLTDLYVADLDAIMRGHAEATDDSTGAKAGASSLPAQDTLVAAVAAVGAPLWLDAGVSSATRAQHAIAHGATRVIVALETLPSYEALAEICAAVGGDRVAFSLDLREGEPVVATGHGIPSGRPAHEVAARAIRAGAGSVIVIDLARVGTGRGLDLELIARVRDAVPGQLLAGGGVRGLEDLERLADAGCDGALVASALVDGRIGASEIAAMHGHASFSR